MNVIEKIGITGIVPVVVIEDAKDAVPTATAFLSGGIDVMEITLRTGAALVAIKEVAAHCPGMLLGAGTVLSLAQCKMAVEAGATFIVSPGYDEDIVGWCVQHNIAVTPGCVTPTEIMAALKHGIRVIKFFPSNIYGGFDAMKALSAPFAEISFIPTGGVGAANLNMYLSAPFVHAVGGSWLCTKADISAGNFARISALCSEASSIAAGFELAHVGINTMNEETALRVAGHLSDAFGLELKPGTHSNFVGGAVEVMKSDYLGANGHIAIRTNSIPRAIAYLEKKGIATDPETAKTKNGKLSAIYLKGDIGGFAIHLVQK